jgi:alpha-ribazole phosphatase/probable phosphoglycerate mutase
MYMTGWTDVPLSARGRAEAALLHERLVRADGRFAALYVSPLQRAVATAAPLMPLSATPMKVDAGLREIDCGVVDGLSVEAAKHLHAEAWARNERRDDERFRWPGGESYREFRARCLRTLRAIARRHAGGRVLVVTHAGLISQALGAFSGLSCARWDLLRPSNASISEIAWSPSGRRVLYFDDREHLEPSGVRPRATPHRLAG